MNKEDILIKNERNNAFFKALPHKIDDILENENYSININNNNNDNNYLNFVIIFILITYLIYLFCK